MLFIVHQCFLMTVSHKIIVFKQALQTTKKFFQVVFVLGLVTSKNKTKMSIDVELLISSIQERPPLWDQSNKKYIGFSKNAGRLCSARHRIALPSPARLWFVISLREVTT